MKMRFAILSLSALSLFAVSSYAAGDTKINGWISDSMCGAKHMGTGAACAKKCIEGGSRPVFVDEKKAVWTIDNPDAVKDDYGKHVAITATPDASNKSVHITAVSVIGE